ncbi:MAG TPA: pyridoxal phosphate-dependent aminotransferase [Gemmataceae bacterium]|nr:pyridoxal phosphate-dependent aminotransferase [Gemmataceae bacterium]
MLPISKMAAAVQPSATLAAGAKAKQLKMEGKTVYDFSLGEPDFNTPRHICDAAYKAMLDGHTHYTAASGMPELRGAIARWYKRVYGYEFTPEQVVVSNGAKHSLHNALAASVGPGDEVIIPTPYWVSYSDLVQMTGACYKLVPTTAESGFKMTPAQFKAAITPRSKLVMINSPSNPTGSVYTRAELAALAEVALAHNVGVISDEIYEQLVYGNAKATCFATLLPKLAENTITISGVSKSYAMTGWRIGWSISPLHVAKAMGNVQSQETSSPSSVSQHAAIAGLDGDQGCVQQMLKEFEARRDLVCSRLNAMPGIKCPIPDGAFYAFFNVEAHFGTTRMGKQITDSTSFCAAALETVHVNLVQGSAFGAEGWVRLSFATSRDQINKGMDKLAEFLKG